MASCGRSYEECIQTSPCFKHKMTYWRGNPAVGVCPPAAERNWCGPTIREQVREMTDTAKAEGRELEYVGRAAV